MMTTDELRELSAGLRAKSIKIDDELVGRIATDVEEYRAILAARPTPLPPPELAARLPLMGWLIYETSWLSVQQVRSSFGDENTDPAERAKSEAEFDRVERIADCARQLPWPEFAPRALGSLRALALGESKRDTEEGYLAAWTSHGEAGKKYESFWASYGSDETGRQLKLSLDEMFLQLALGETGTACRRAELVIARWAEQMTQRPVAEQEDWIQRMFRELSDGVSVGERALDTGERIREESGFVDKVDEHRFTQQTALQNPGIMTARAASILLAMRPAMEWQGSRPPGSDSWDSWERQTLRRFERAYRAVEAEIPGKPKMDANFERQLVHVRLNLALLKPGYDLPSARAGVLPCLAINPLGPDAVEAMSAWLGRPGEKGRERALGAATMPLFIRSLIAGRGLGPSDTGYQEWRIRWFSLDQDSAVPGRLDRVRAALAAAAA